jgi:hypothetical protein
MAPKNSTGAGTKSKVASRLLPVAPLALAVLAQTGIVGHGPGTGSGGAAPPDAQAVNSATQPVKCGSDGITDYQECHDRFPTGCSQGGKYDGYLNSLKNRLFDPATEPKHSFAAGPSAGAGPGVHNLVDLEKQLPKDLTKNNHEQFKTEMGKLGEGDVSALSGYLYYAKNGGSESSNCLLQGADDIDFHIGIGGDANLAGKAQSHQQLSPGERSQAVIVEMTPHWRAQYAPAWTLAQVQKAVGRQVYVVGQLLADNEHDDPNDDCAHQGAGTHCWRATIWELHPVTRFLVCAAASCASDGTRQAPARRRPTASAPSRREA